MSDDPDAGDDLADKDTSHLARRDFDAFIETVAENNRERDGSNPRFVAKGVIVSCEHIPEEGGYTLLFNARPYYDGSRAYPKDIIRGCPDDVTPIESGAESPTLWELAVDVVEDELIDYYDDHGWEGINR